jgi:hypothetical protein
MPKKSDKTLVTLLLDRSGSMNKVKSQTVEAINSYISHLKDGGDDIRFSFIMFDAPFPGDRMDLEKLHVGRKIADVPALTDDDFLPRGMTPLIDAAFQTIRAVEASLKGKSGTKVVIAIQTDGDENASRENGWSDLKSLIAEKEQDGWQFNFMGAGINAYQQSERMGISRSKTISYGMDKKSTHNAFEATASVTRAFASGSILSTNYADTDKLAAGDNWHGKL